MLTTAFIKSKHFKVIERAQLEKAMKELKIGMSGLIDPDNAKKIGKMLGAGYMVVGSISDMGNKISFDARIVNIETGESVTASDASTSSTGDAASSVTGSTPGPTASASNTSTPAVNIPAQANSTSAGQMVGQGENFGLLGGSKFKVAWKENLGTDEINSFAAGDVIGDGSRRLMVAKPQTIEMLKWSSGRFVSSWRSEPLKSDFRYLTVPPLKDKASLWSSKRPYGTQRLVWDGTTFTVMDYKILGGVTGWWVESKMLSVGGWRLNQFNVEDNWSYSEKYTRGCFNQIADFDGDSKLEIAAGPDWFHPNVDKIVFIDTEDQFKTDTLNAYNSPLAVWQPAGVKKPYLVALKNELVKDGNQNVRKGGYFYLIQWNGETYEEIFKSTKLGDRIVDVKVCEPKGEGKDGHIVLYQSKKDYYLLKVVAE